MKKLTIIKTFYGRNKYPVFTLNYNDGGELPTFTRKNSSGVVDEELVDRIFYAIENNFVIEVKDETEKIKGAK